MCFKLSGQNRCLGCAVKVAKKPTAERTSATAWKLSNIRTNVP